MILLIDNYDSFTYNLVQALGAIGLEDPRLRHEIVVVRNDEQPVDQLAARRPTHLIISPGPCTPAEGGISIAAIHHFDGRIPILGVCLGHQCIAAAYGGRIIRADRILHGKTAAIHHDGRTIFAGLPNPFTAARYHSLLVDPDSLNKNFEVSARSPEGECMGLRLKDHPTEGVQFHPESFMTPEGIALLRNFLLM